MNGALHCRERNRGIVCLFPSSTVQLHFDNKSALAFQWSHLKGRENKMSDAALTYFVCVFCGSDFFIVNSNTHFEIASGCSVRHNGGNQPQKYGLLVILHNHCAGINADVNVFLTLFYADVVTEKSRPYANGHHTISIFAVDELLLVSGSLGRHPIAPELVGLSPIGLRRSTRAKLPSIANRSSANVSKVQLPGAPSKREICSGRFPSLRASVTCVIPDSAKACITS